MVSRKKSPPVEDRPLDEALISLLARHADGVTITKVRALLPAPYKVDKTRLEQRLRALESSKRVHAWSKTVVAPSSYADAAKRAILAALRESPRSLSELKKSLTLAVKTGPELTKALLAARDAGELFEHPKVPGAKKSVLRYALQAPDAGAYLAPIDKAIDALTKKLRGSGIDRAAIVAALTRSITPSREMNGRELTAREGNGHKVDPRAFFDAVLSIRPDARAHVLISVRDVRRRLSWPKPDFDDLVLRLAREGRITLHHHDHPAGLPISERDDLVADERGTHYIGFVLEENA